MGIDLLKEINELLEANYKDLEEIPRSQLLKVIAALLIAIEINEAGR